MSFFNIMKSTRGAALAASPEMLHRLECSACTLNCITSNKHPHMTPTGAKKPLVYILGDAPGVADDEANEQFMGESGDVLRRRIPRDWYNYVRFNNVVRTKTPKGRAPTDNEIECCRPSIIRDIEATKPAAIFGFGPVPLMWALRATGITKWNGRRAPVQIGSHRCWFYPMMDPLFILKSRRFEPRKRDDYGSDLEFTFAFDMKRAFADVDEGLPDPIVHTKEQAEVGVEIITGGEPGALDTVLDFLWDCDRDEEDVGLDYETNRKRPYWPESKILTAAVSGQDRTVAWAFDHPGAEWAPSDLRTLKAEYRRWLMTARCRKIVHALSFEQEWSGVMFGRDVIRAGDWECTLTQSYVIDERPGSHDLDQLCLEHFGIHLKEFSGLDRSKLEFCLVNSVLRYNGLDAKYHRLLCHSLRRRIEEIGGDIPAVYQRAVRRVPTVVLTQIKGVPIDPKTVAKFKDKYEEEQEAAEDKIADLPAVVKWERLNRATFNPGSNKQILSVLSMLGYKDIKSTDEKVIVEIDEPFVKAILDYRDVTKALSTYVEPVSPGSDVLFPGNLLHPILTTTTTRTWRTASKDVNSQNWPKRGHRKEVRGQSIAGKGKKYVSFDFAGIQARNVAMESLDTALVAAFWEDYDIHGEWRDTIISLYPRWIKEGMKAYRLDKKLQKDYRGVAKNKMVFPSFFGAFPKTIARHLGVPEEIGHKVHDKFWKAFPEIKDWQTKTIADYNKTGYVTGLSGFRRHAPVAITEIVNAPIQADEALIVCDAMSSLSEMEHKLKLNHDDYQANMEIHDDLTFIWEERHIEENAKVVAREMTRLTYSWMAAVPIVVEMSIGDTWADMVEQEHKFSSVEIWGHKRNKK